MSPTKPTVPALTTASAVSVAQATNSSVRQASSASPTVRARSRLHEERRSTGDHGEERADGGATRDPQHIRVGEGIAEQGLQQHPGERQQTPDAESREHAWQAHAQEDTAGRRIARAAERL